jgi:hypothetical protein
MPPPAACRNRRNSSGSQAIRQTPCRWSAASTSRISLAWRRYARRMHAGLDRALHACSEHTLDHTGGRSGATERVGREAEVYSASDGRGRVGIAGAFQVSRCMKPCNRDSNGAKERGERARFIKRNVLQRQPTGARRSYPTTVGSRRPRAQALHLSSSSLLHVV